MSKELTKEIIKYCFQKLGLWDRASLINESFKVDSITGKYEDGETFSFLIYAAQLQIEAKSVLRCVAVDMGEEFACVFQRNEDPVMGMKLSTELQDFGLCLRYQESWGTLPIFWQGRLLSVWAALEVSGLVWESCANWNNLIPRLSELVQLTTVSE